MYMPICCVYEHDTNRLNASIVVVNCETCFDHFVSKKYIIFCVVTPLSCNSFRRLTRSIVAKMVSSCDDSIKYPLRKLCVLPVFSMNGNHNHNIRRPSVLIQQMCLHFQPKTKRKFIDKKNAVTFHLVHRSQKDPLITDETAPQHVLLEAKAPPKAKDVSINCLTTFHFICSAINQISMGFYVVFRRVTSIPSVRLKSENMAFSSTMSTIIYSICAHGKTPMPCIGNIWRQPI